MSPIDINLAVDSLVGCECMEVFLPLMEKLLVHRGLLHKNIDITQGCYNHGEVPASANTHDGGGVWDDINTSGPITLTMREHGVARFVRPLNWNGIGGMAHNHNILIGCPHNTPARYQVGALEAGYNGLGYGGRKGADRSARPTSWVTWDQGVAMMKMELGLVRQPVYRRGVVKVPVLNYRATPDGIYSSTAKVLGELRGGQNIVLTGKQSHGWREMLVSRKTGQTAWVAQQFLALYES